MKLPALLFLNKQKAPVFTGALLAKMEKEDVLRNLLILDIHFQ